MSLGKYVGEAGQGIQQVIEFLFLSLKLNIIYTKNVNSKRDLGLWKPSKKLEFYNPVVVTPTSIKSSG